MRILVQRVRSASVSVEGNVVGSINSGLLAFVGITHSDNEATVHWMAEKLLTLRILSDAEGRMNLSLLDVGGGLLIVSQFTLYGDLAKGTRPSFVRASHPNHALALYNMLLDELSGMISLKGASVNLAAGVFGAMMDVSLVNQGPVTIILERA